MSYFWTIDGQFLGGARELKEALTRPEVCSATKAGSRFILIDDFRNKERLRFTSGQWVES